MEILDLIIDNLDIEEREIKKVIIGLYTTYVANDTQAGLSSTLYFSSIVSGQSHKHFYIGEAGKLHKKTGIDLCKYIYSDVIIEASVGMAAINSYIKINLDKCQELNASGLIMAKGENKNVAVIGHFPFINKLKNAVKNLWVFDLSQKEEEDLLPDKMEEFLPQSNVIAITGTSFLNKTFENILKYIKKDAYKIILGPSTPMTEILFDYGIDALCGSYVEDNNLVENYITQAVPFKFIKGVKHLTMTREGW